MNKKPFLDILCVFFAIPIIILIFLFMSMCLFISWPFIPILLYWYYKNNTTYPEKCNGEF